MRVLDSYHISGKSFLVSTSCHDFCGFFLVQFFRNEMVLF